MNKRFSKLLAGSLIISSVFFFSCESTEQTGDNSSQESVQASASLSDVKLEIVSTPKETIKNTAFASPYKVRAVTNDGSALPSYPITVTYPDGRNAESVTFANTDIVTGDDGTAEFLPPVCNFAVNGTVKFAPKAKTSNPKVVKQLEALAVEAPFKVKTNFNRSSIIIVALLDYNQAGNRIEGLSSSELMGELWRQGLTSSQNADLRIVGKSVEAEDPALIKTSILKMIGDNGRFRSGTVVYGKVKYASEITKTDDGMFTVTLTGTMGVLSLSDGEVKLTATKTATVKDKNQWNLMKLARTEIEKQFIDELMYSL